MRRIQLLNAFVLIFAFIAAADVGGQSSTSVKRSGHAGDITALAIAPDGKIAASAGDDGTVRIWDLATGREKTVLTRENPDGADKRAIPNCIVFSPDGSLFAVGFDNGVQLWKTADWKPTSNFSDSVAGVEFIAFSPDGRKIATGERKPEIDLSVTGIDTAPDLEITDLETNEVVRSIHGAYGPLAFHPNGKMLVFTGSKGEIFFLDLESDENDPPGVKLKDDDDRLAALVFDQTGDHLYSLADTAAFVGGDIRVWRPADHKLGSTRGFKSEGVLLSAPGTTNIVISEGMFADNSLTIVNSQTGSVAGGVSREVADVQAPASISRDGRIIIAVGKNGHDFHVIDLKEGKNLLTLQGYTTVVTSLVFTPDGKDLIAGYDDERLIWWNVDEGTIRQAVTAQDNKPTIGFSSGTGTALVSPDAKYFLTEGSVYSRFDATTGRLAGPDLTSTTDVAVAFSSDGKLLGFADKNAIRLYAAATGKLVKRFPLVAKSDSRSPKIALSSDGRMIAIAGPTVAIRDVATGTIKRAIPASAADAVEFQMLFSPDAKYLVVGRWVDGHEVQVYSVGTGRSLYKLDDRTHNFAISPDSKVLAVINGYNDVEFVDLGTGKVISKSETSIESSDMTFRLVYSRDGKRLAVGTSRGITVLDASAGTIIRTMR